MNSIRLAREIHQRFGRLPGSEHIATEHAISGVLEWIIRSKPKVMLEVGSGIGTLTYASIRALLHCHGQSGREPHFRLVCLEDNEFCLSELRKNLSEHLHQFEVYTSIEAIPDDIKEFDFVIVDGGSTSEAYFSRLSERGIVFVEQYRKKQRAVIESVHRDRRWSRLHSTGSLLAGDYWVYRFEPTVSERLLIGWWNLQNQVPWNLYSRVCRRVHRLRASGQVRV